MEIITKEELLEIIGVSLSDDELENVSGGGVYYDVFANAKITV